MLLTIFDFIGFKVKNVQVYFKIQKWKVDKKINIIFSKAKLRNLKLYDFEMWNHEILKSLETSFNNNKKLKF